MKNIRFIIALLLSATCCLNAAAQSSTEENPKWYYIQVKGAGISADRVLTEIDGQQVLGQPLTTTDIDAVNKQLWRFDIQTEGSYKGYKVINKHSKKQLTVVYNATRNRREPAVAANSSTLWTFPGSSTAGYSYLRILNEPQEGAQGEVFLSQTVYNDYVYRLVTEANRTSANELFRWVANEIPVISTGNTTLWMTVRNPKTNKYLTDAVSSGTGANFTLETPDNSEAQQWKMTGKENGNVDFVNRATGNLVSTETNLNKYYYVNYLTDPAVSAGWKYAPISNASSQYEIYSTGSDGVVSYWNATTDGRATDSYSPANTANSTYAWIFTWVEEIRTGISQPAAVTDNIRVYSVNRRIYVEGCNEYRVTTLSGLSVRKDIELPLGIYLVTVKGKTTKILIK